MYLTWLEKTNNERKEYLQEIKDNLNIEYDESEFLNKWNKFLKDINDECILYRLREYPTINELIIAQYEGDAREMHDIRNAVRNKYPKVIDTTD